jgi:hypothetical protein
MEIGGNTGARTEDEIVTHNRVRHCIDTFTAILNRIAFDNVCGRATAVDKYAGELAPDVGIMDHIVANNIPVGIHLTSMPSLPPPLVLRK